jgi:hypothetical protein
MARGAGFNDETQACRASGDDASQSQYLKSSQSRQPSLSLICPACGSDMVYIPRRVIDRLLHWMRPVQRYRCTGFKCGYEGNRRSHKLVRLPVLFQKSAERP